MAETALSLPRYMVLEGRGSVRLELTLPAPACEIDVRIENPAPDRSFVLVLADTRGTLLQRVRLAGGARIYFAPRRAGTYLVFLSNPGKESVTLYLRARTSSGRSGRTRGAGEKQRPTRRVVVTEAAPPRPPPRKRSSKKVRPETRGHPRRSSGVSDQSGGM